jgi:hypothetical protein
MKHSKKFFIILLLILVALILSLKMVYDCFKRDFINESRIITKYSNLSKISGKLLINNDLLPSKYFIFNCMVINNNKFYTNCKDAQKLTAKPMLMYTLYKKNKKVSNEKIINNDYTIKLKLLNQKEGIYKGIFDGKNNVITKEKSFKISKNIQSGKYYYKFDDNVLSFHLNIDNDNPIYTNSVIKDNYYMVNYSDENNYRVYYYYSNVKQTPINYNKFKSVQVIPNDCKNINYFLYSYAIDVAGNRSDVNYLGEVKANCQLTYNKKLFFKYQKS